MSRHEFGTSTPLEIEVRPGVLDDIPRLVEIEREETHTWRHLPDRLRTQIEFDAGMLLVAVVDGRVVGYLSGNYVNDDNEWWLRRLVVARGLRGRGVGTALCTSALETIDERGAACNLWVVAANRGAIALYERLGFERSPDQYIRGLIRMRRPPQA